MRRFGRKRDVAGLFVALLASSYTGVGTAAAQTAECAALRSEIDGARGVVGGSFDLAIDQQRSEIERTRAYADESGCNGGSVFDDPDAPQCRSIAARLAQLEAGLRRLREQASAGETARRDLLDRFNAACTATDQPNAGEAGVERIVPVDPGASPDASPAVPAGRYARVLCVRRCDGAFYPLAADVPADQVDDLDRVCKAQCPAADAGAFTSREDEDIGKAVAQDGSGASYATLPYAFLFQRSTMPGCACRDPRRNWAETLAGAEAMLEPHKGDVTVTPEVAARLETPGAAPRRGGPSTTAKPAARPRAASVPRVIAPLVSPQAPMTSPSIIDEAPEADAGETLTRQLRQSVPPP